MITAKGVGFLIAAILLFFLGRLTQVGWLYLVDALLWGIILLSFLLPWVQVAYLRAQRRLSWGEGKSLSTGPAEGDEVTVDLSLQNRGFWPKFFLTVSYEGSLAPPESRQTRFLVSKVSGSSEFHLPATVEARQRGMQSLLPTTVEASAPFGLFRRRVQLDGRHDLLVYPQIYPLNRLHLVDGLAGEMTHAQKSRLGMESAGSRPYFPGDPRRHIHWRNTARTSRPMVREFEDPRDTTLHLVFSADQCWGEGKETTLEYSIKLIASVADYGRLNRVPVQVRGGLLDGNRIWDGDWPGLLRELALVEAGQGPSLAQSLEKLPAGASALAIFNGGDRQDVRALTQAGGNLNRLVVIALEEFGQADNWQDILNALPGHRVQLIRCRPGQLANTIQQMEGLERPSQVRTRAA